MTKTLSLLAIFSLLVFTAPVFAVPAIVVPSGETVNVPIVADNHSPVISLGTAVDKSSGKMVEGYAIIHYKNNNAGNFAKGARTPACYAFLSKGARWKITEPYVVGSGINALAVTRDLETWDSKVAFEVFGNQDVASLVDGADIVKPDNKNEIMWGNISTPGAIAVAIVWGIFSGPLEYRQIVEYDVVFDNIDYTWGDAAINPGVMDFENIATHELGHGAGMADLYQGGCSEETMYGYADNGEIKKRDLNAGDIVGIKALYR